jgi:hypothetical protein
MNRQGTSYGGKHNEEANHHRCDTSPCAGSIGVHIRASSVCGCREGTGSGLCPQLQGHHQDHRSVRHHGSRLLSHSCGAGHHRQRNGQVQQTGTDVTDFRLLVDGKLVPKNYTAFGSGSVGVIYGTYTTGMSTDDYNSSISGTSFPVKVGKHALVYEILGVNGSVLATSASYSVTVPKQAAAVKPTLTYTATDQSYAPYFNVGNIDVYSATTGTLDATPNVLSFTVPAGVTLTDADGAQPNVTQSGTTVSITEARDVSLALPGSQWPPSFGFSYQSGNMSAPLTISSVTLDGIPVTPAS